MKKMNQIRPNRVNHIGPAQTSPKKVKLWFKCGTSSMLFCKAPEADALRIEARLRRMLRDLDVKLEGSFIQTQ